MVRVITHTGYDYVKADRVTALIHSGYIIAVYEYQVNKEGQ